MFAAVPCCDDCWWNDTGEYPLKPNGRGVAEEGDLRFPSRLKPQYREEVTCHFCGFATLSGIYVRVDTDEVPPAEPQFREEE